MPSTTPAPAAIKRPDTQPPPPIRSNARAVTYCTIEAATAKEMSIPPAISTTSRPTAKMMLTALMFRRSKALPSEKKFAVAKESTALMTTITASSENSVA
jgi:hypothetical protein